MSAPDVARPGRLRTALAELRGNARAWMRAWVEGWREYRALDRQERRHLHSLIYRVLNATVTLLAYLAMAIWLLVHGCPGPERLPETPAADPANG